MTTLKPPAPSARPLSAFIGFCRLCRRPSGRVSPRPPDPPDGPLIIYDLVSFTSFPPFQLHSPSAAPPRTGFFCLPRSRAIVPCSHFTPRTCGDDAGLSPSTANLFSVFPEKLAARLFAKAKPTKLAADEVLFLAGDPGDGCYRVETGPAEGQHDRARPARSGFSPSSDRAPSSANSRPSTACRARRRSRPCAIPN